MATRKRNAVSVKTHIVQVGACEMGVAWSTYLPEPETEKVSSDEANDKLICGASSMQGWRRNQEVSGRIFRSITRQMCRCFERLLHYVCFL